MHVSLRIACLRWLSHLTLRASSLLVALHSACVPEAEALRQAVEPGVNWQAASEGFPRLLPLLQTTTYHYPLLAGLVISVGGACQVVRVALLLITCANIVESNCVIYLMGCWMTPWRRW